MPIMHSELSRRALLFLLAGSRLAAAPFWRKKPFLDWDADEVRRLLTDSPWAKSMTISVDLNPPSVRKPPPRGSLGLPGTESAPAGGTMRVGGSPVGGIGVPRAAVRTDAQLTIRWSSALPEKQAAAVAKYGAKAATLPEAKQLLEPEKHFYVIETTGLPAMVAYMGAQSLAYELRQTIRLRTGSGRIIPADSVYIPVRGARLDIIARFSRSKPITLKDKKVEYRITTKMFRFKQEFKLKSMVYHGHLEL